MGTTFYTIICLVMGALGLATAFFGYRYLKVFLGIYGFLSAATAGAIAANTFLPGQSAFLIVCAIAGGVIGAVASILAFDVGLFILGASGGCAGGYFLYVAANNQLHPIAIPVLAVAGGVASLILRKVITTLVTAAFGSILAGFGILCLIQQDYTALQLRDRTSIETYLRAIPQENQILLMTVLCLTVAAILIQFLVTGKLQPKKEEEKGEKDDDKKKKKKKKK